jgi:hypothetical protein
VLVFAATAANANSGAYALAEWTRHVGAAGLAFRGIVKTPPSFTNERVWFLGFMDTISTTPPTDCACFVLNGTAGEVRGRARANGTAVETSDYTLAADTWYWFDVDYLANNSVRYSISNDAGSLLFQQTITDSQVPNTLARAIGFGLTAYRVTSGAGDVVAVVDYMGAGPARPPYAAVPLP